MEQRQKAAALGALSVCVGAMACYKWNFRVPLKEYKQYARRMAALDDEICRNELGGNKIKGRTIVFPPKSETIRYRYRLFLEMNRRKNRKVLQREIAEMECRLKESEQYLETPGIELEDVCWDD